MTIENVMNDILNQLEDCEENETVILSQEEAIELIKYIKPEMITYEEAV